jgi:hypothetical protein
LAGWPPVIARRSLPPSGAPSTSRRRQRHPKRPLSSESCGAPAWISHFARTVARGTCNGPTGLSCHTEVSRHEHARHPFATPLRQALPQGPAKPCPNARKAPSKQSPAGDTCATSDSKCALSCTNSSPTPAGRDQSPHFHATLHPIGTAAPFNHVLALMRRILRLPRHARGVYSPHEG